MLGLNSTDSRQIIKKMFALVAVVIVALIGVHLLQQSRAAVPGVVVSGNRLYKDGLPFTPRGFTMVGLLTPPGCSQGNGVAAYSHLNQAEMNAAAAWKANTLRFQVSFTGLNGYTADQRTEYLDRIKAGVKLARDNGFVVLLSLQDQSIGCGPARPLPVPESLAVWTTLANTFKADPYILFQLWNEPDNEPDANRLATSDPNYASYLAWPDWKDGRTTAISRDSASKLNWAPYVPVGHQQLVDKIRDTGATNVIIATGANKGEHLERMPLLSDPLATDQLAYSAHTYYFTTSRADWDNRFGYLAATKPMLVTEWNSDCGVAKQESMAQAHLDYLQEKHIGFTPWGFDFMNTLISDWNYTPTSPTNCRNKSGGEIVKAYFLAYPKEDSKMETNLSLEAEGGALSDAAIPVDDTAASASKAVKFGASPAP